MCGVSCCCCGGKKAITSNILDDCNEWIRLVTLISHAGTSALRDIFHDPSHGGKSRDPFQLYQDLKPYRNKLKKLLKKDEFELVYPSSQQTFSVKFDITILCVLIINCTNVPAPTTGWLRKPNQSDWSIGACIVRLRRMRNKMMHFAGKLTRRKFLKRWDKTINILRILGYDITEVMSLKNESLNDSELYQSAIMAASVECLNKHVNTITDEIKAQKLSSAAVTNSIDVLNRSINLITTDVQNCLTKQDCFDSDLITINEGFAELLKKTDELENNIDISNEELKQDFEQMTTAMKEIHVNVEEKIERFETKMVMLCERIESIEERKNATFDPATFNERCSRAVESIKNDVIAKHSRESIEHPFRNENLMKMFYVDLMISNSREFQKMCSKSDREHHINMQLNHEKSIGIENLLSKKYSFLLLRGVAGIGKSVLTKHCAYLWATNNLWHDKKFVFNFTCREMNSSSASSFEELLRCFYPNIFYYISLQELLEIGKEIVVVIDGIDEFVGISQFDGLSSGQPISSLPITKCVFHMLNLTDNILDKSDIIVSGRPESCTIISSCFSRFAIKCVDILGFSLISVHNYIDFYFSKDYKRARLVRKVINSSINIQLMTRIPVYLKVICSLYENDDSFKPPKTTSELYTMQLALFMKKHCQVGNGENIVNKSLLKFVQNVDICRAIIDLASISFTMLKNDVVVFNEEAIETFTSLQTLEATGMIMKVHGPLENKYQFFHLSMQEFLAAIFIVFNKLDVYVVQQDFRLKSTLPLIFGIIGAERRKKNKVDLAASLMQSLRIANQSANSSNWANYNDECELFLNSYHEYQGQISAKEKLDYYLSCKLTLPHHMIHLLFFLDRDIKHLRKLKLSITDTSAVLQNTGKDSEKLLTHILNMKEFESDDLTVSALPHLPEYNKMNLNLKYLSIFLTDYNLLFDWNWFNLPSIIHIRLGYGLESLCYQICANHLSLRNLFQITVEVLDTDRTNFRHLLRLIELLQDINMVTIQLNCNDTENLYPSVTCKDIKHGMQNMEVTCVTLIFRAEEHIYRRNADVITCENCVVDSNSETRSTTRHSSRAHSSIGTTTPHTEYPSRDLTPSMSRRRTEDVFNDSVEENDKRPRGGCWLL
ncbi:NACHT, LRR and PYD domains-containing protein 3-like isoform X2 [Hydractinia symbiolongicarpus]|uniref:NACHT, LRR and PYD domains-containing protein 3-like isoform X2 n=1 Tax=Hydractinia symbiolongicarpus TaxID=13093 RepID=UPI00254C85B4|nr:NACHT, LRR and PYD domains-containing protein 3-like isoform X2 [Hydractinia symbiolongicarpus]